MRILPPLNYSVLDLARAFMVAAHCGVEQKRKYTGEDYTVHPEETLQILMTYTEPPIAAQCAMLLHDILEDTGVTRNHIAQVFGQEIAELVESLTDVSKPEDGNRKTRKQKDLAHIASGGYWTKLMKCADLISNTRSIAKYDGSFAVTYLDEVFQILMAFLSDLEVAESRIYDKAVKDTFAAMELTYSVEKYQSYVNAYNQYRYGASE